MADQGGLAQIEMLDDGGQVVGQGVDVVAGGGPVGPAVATAVVQHAVQARGGEGGDLVIPLVRPQSPGVGEHHRRPAAPVSDE